MIAVRVTLLACVLAGGTDALAETWTVGPSGQADFVAIQSAIDAAAAGDSVAVAPGEYFENLHFRGHDIVLIGVDGPSVTVINGSQMPESVIRLSEGETQHCIIQGFTITGGNVGPPACRIATGAGIFADDATPSIIGNIIHGNIAHSFCGGYGAGILVRSFAPGVPTARIIGNLIWGNVATGNGGGITIAGTAAAEIRENEIRDNVVQVGDGAGIWLQPNASGTVIADNTIHHNSANDHGGGIYIGGDLSNPRITISGNLIYANTSGSGQDQSGGGVWIAHAEVDLRNNTIVQNESKTFNDPSGGGVAVAFGGIAHLERNIIALSREGGGVYCDNRGSSLTALDNVVWANADGDGTGQCPAWFVGNGNTVADPLFCNSSEDDYSLPPNSPALTHPSGPIGAISEPGCTNGVIVRSVTWGMIKALMDRD